MILTICYFYLNAFFYMDCENFQVNHMVTFSFPKSIRYQWVSFLFRTLASLLIDDFHFPMLISSDEAFNQPDYPRPRFLSSHCWPATPRLPDLEPNDQIITLLATLTIKRNPTEFDMRP
ncbi:hypothetical protein J6590_046766 [Homalodisca vitripennis]|nr:hypothetical protein J6590_046766 [Homalodisca vitripennis]